MFKISNEQSFDDNDKINWLNSMEHDYYRKRSWDIPQIENYFIDCEREEPLGDDIEYNNWTQEKIDQENLNNYNKAYSFLKVLKNAGGVITDIGRIKLNDRFEFSGSSLSSLKGEPNILWTDLKCLYDLQEDEPVSVFEMIDEFPIEIKNFVIDNYDYFKSYNEGYLLEERIKNNNHKNSDNEIRKSINNPNYCKPIYEKYHKLMKFLIL